MSSIDSSWLESVVNLNDGYEVRAVEEFTSRLLGLARSRMPERLKSRLDPEDIVQSVFTSFFKRNEANQFDFKNANDLWRLLAAITYYKVQSAIEFHGRKRRDYSLDMDSETANASPTQADPSASTMVMMTEMLDQILEQVPSVHQKILQLRLENCSIAEIAEKVQVSTRTVDRALKNVRKVAQRIIDESRTD